MTQLFREDASFLAGGGEMGAIIRRHDWHKTSLGPPGSWPRALKVAVRLLLSSGHPMFIWWGPRLIQFYNDAYCRSIGPERHPSALGQEGRECWLEIWPIIGPQIEQVMVGQGHTWHENQLVPITRHGSRQDVYWTYSYSPIDDPDAPNSVGGVLVICTETTDQVLNERRWRMAEAKWRALFDLAPVFMCTLKGPQHIFEYANPEYLRVVGRRDIVGKPMVDALPEVVTQGFLDLLDQVYQNGQPYQGHAVPVDFALESTHSQQRRFVDFIYQPLTGSDNQVTGIFVVGYDVTEIVLSGQRLQEQDRRKDEFLAMLAHELRNPLAPITNVAQWLTQNATDQVEIRQAGEMLKRQCTQLTHLVNDLLDVSRITRGIIELKNTVVDVDDMVRVALESAQPQLVNKKHDLIYVSSDEELFVLGDLQRLVQCLSNVLVNAIKYTPPGGVIRVTVKRVDSNVAVEVADNGIGITPEMLPKIFDLFTQVDPTIDRAQGGLGIGLSIVHRLVQMHSGSFAAVSEGLGRGSQFTIQLPLTEHRQPMPPEPSGLNSQSCRILIVDDNVDAAESLAHLLAYQGHKTLAVYSAADGLRRLAAFTPDVAVLDIGLPDMNGYELARHLRTRSSSMVLIALTGYGTSEDRRQSEEAGFDCHLTKPVAIAELEEVIESKRRNRISNPD
jgi:signal transduction histidine kinase/ActR/RegA family two-component response regulator